MTRCSDHLILYTDPMRATLLPLHARLFIRNTYDVHASSIQQQQYQQQSSSKKMPRELDILHIDPRARNLRSACYYLPESLRRLLYTSTTCILLTTFGLTRDGIANTPLFFIGGLGVVAFVRYVALVRRVYPNWLHIVNYDTLEVPFPQQEQDETFKSDWVWIHRRHSGKWIVSGLEYFAVSLLCGWVYAGVSHLLS